MRFHGTATSFSTAPAQVGSAKVAMLLQRNGLTRVRPLLGGIDAWRERNYPVESRQRGFTLIELLVVIAVIALLAFLLLPAVAGAKGRAHAITLDAGVKPAFTSWEKKIGESLELPSH